jgi:hypothetical protein
MNRDRVEAHYRWAGRYAERGNAAKAIAHFGRAWEIEEQRGDGAESGRILAATVPPYEAQVVFRPCESRHA